MVPTLPSSWEGERVIALPRLAARGIRTALERYRAGGADLPFGDPLPAHGVAMEGYFWRITDPVDGRVVIALIGVNRDARGGHWATLGLATHPAGTLAIAAAPDGWAAPDHLAVRSETEVGSFVADADRLEVDLGPGARLRISIDEAAPWPHRAFGGSSVFQSVPALNQYWHPWLLGGVVHGDAEVGDERWSLDGATVYGEKNWGKEGFPDAWWWGQAQAFADPGACVAFAGGQVHSGPLRAEVTAVVVRLPDGSVIRLGNPGTSPVTARVTDTTWDLHGRSLAGWEVDISGYAALGDAHVLPVPLPSERRNTAGALEHLGATMSVTLRRRGVLVWEGRSDLAALEHGGLARAEAELRRRGIPASAGATHAAPRLP